MAYLPLTSLLSLLSPGGRRGRLSILIYHRVLPLSDPFVPWGVSAEVFDCQIQALRDSFNIIPLAEAIARLSTGSLPWRAACVTFDDGYKDNLTVALPILRRYGIRPTVFVASGFLDDGRMWNDTLTEAVRLAPDGELDLTDLRLGRHTMGDRLSRLDVIAKLLQQVKYLPHKTRVSVAEQIGERAGRTLPRDLMLSQEDVRTLSSAGADIGGHTLSHPILSGLDDRSAQREIAENRIRLGEIVRSPIRVFAYPNGRPGRDYTKVHTRMVRNCGYAGAVSTAPGTSSRSSDLYQLPRFTPWDTTPLRFSLRLARNLLDRQSREVKD